jgi:hypothetical protein
VFLSRRVLFFAILQAIGTALLAQVLPPRLRQTLTTNLKASQQQLKTLEGGGIVAYSVETGAREDIMLVGMARIWATPEAFIRGYRDITAFEAAPGVIAANKFSIPPKDSDFSGLSLSREEADELKACKPGKCAFKIGDPGMQLLHGAVQWKSPDYADQASKALRALWLQYLVRYQSTGNDGLAVYHDTPKYFSVEQGLNDLLAKATALQEYAPQLAEYLRNYPRSKNESAEEFFYWQVGEFGLKPVHRVTHVVIQKTPASLGDAYVIAAKMLFASHYFQSGLEFRYLVPGQDQRVGGMLYLINVQRSYVDGMTGFRGRFLRSIVVRKSRQAMKRYIASVKEKVERDFNKK